MRDRARTAAELTRERPAPLSGALTEAEREARRFDLEELGAAIDAALGSDEEIPALELLHWATALEVSDEACGPACERRLMFLYDGLALLHAGYFRFSAGAPGEASARYDGMLARAPGLARWAIGRVLAQSDDPTTVSIALQRLAARARDDEGDLTDARRYLEWALSIAPSDPARAALGATCYRLGDLSCGDRALSELEGSPERATIERLRDAARAAAAPATGLEALLRRADALVILQRDDEAIALYEQLAEQHPDDARPLVGRAQVVFFDPAGLLDPSVHGLAAGPYLDRASRLSHREGRYYELATLVWGRRVLSVAMGSDASWTPADLVGQLAEIVAGFREIDAPTAAAVDLYGRLTLRRVGTDLVEAPTLAEGLALVARHPDSPHLRRLSLLLTVSGGARPTEDAFVALPGDDGTLARVRVAAAIQWDDPALMGDVELAGEAGAIALSLRARHGAASWQDVAERFRSALSEASDGGSRIANGHGVAVFWSGDPTAARDLFGRLPGPAPALNLLATTDASLRDDAWVEDVEALVASHDPGIACGAARLLATSGAGTRADIDAACARSGALPPRSGTLSSGVSVDFQFTLSARAGFGSHLAVGIQPWLLVAP